ncbi:MAG: DUF1844 domain-containing protein [Candidatus Eisenbacteria bacterium]|nr:DUF1844 domain-containing protein [Candidatus Eisenbacteria bacterium]
MTETQPDQFFLALLAQNEYLGLVGLGKIQDPATEKSEVDLQKTVVAIGTLEMIERKSRGNLVPEEERELRRILTTLRLNYVEESKREEAGGGASEEQDQSVKEDTAEKPSKPSADQEDAR